jgi:photosystem II stability/assembly factor-like uncharacterized protein
MNKKIMLLGGLIFSLLGTYAQTFEWVQQTKGSGRPIDFHFITKATGWVVGQNGTLLKTSDSGNTWNQQLLPAEITGRHFNGIYFINENQGYAVGNSGTVIYTSNGGTAWNRQNTQTSENLQDVFFYNAQKGWSLGNFGSYQYTLDGGETWIKGTPFSNTSMNSIHFVDSLYGWAGGSTINFTRMYHTQDGGITWTLQKEISRSGGNSTVKVQFVNRTHGWFSDGDEILYTTDGGSSWMAIQKTNNFPYGGCFHFLSQTKGFTISNGTFGTSEDGKTFKVINNLSENHTVLQFFDDTYGLALGDGTLNRTQNGGKNMWEKRAIGTYNIHYSGVDFMDSEKGFAVGSKGFIVKTVNGGLDWTAMNTFTKENLLGIQILDTDNFYVWSSMKLWHSKDQGNSWTLKQEFPNARNVVTFINPNIGWSAGQNGKAYKTTDGGSTWTMQETNNYLEIFCTWFKNEVTGWMGGRGYIYSTNDGGTNWNNTYLGNGNLIQISDIKFLNDSIGYAAAKTHIYKTTDGGKNWAVVYSDNSWWQTTLTLLDENTIVSSGQRTIISYDRGETWEIFSGAPFGFSYFSGNAMKSIGNNKVWLVGNNGSIYHMSNDFASAKSVSKGSRFKYFPNPVEDILKIESSIPLNKNTTLSLYNISGKEVVLQASAVTIEDNILRVNLSDVTPGIFLLCIKGEGDSHTAIIEKR